MLRPSINTGIQTTLHWLLFDQQYIDTGADYFQYSHDLGWLLQRYSTQWILHIFGDTLPNSGQPRAAWYAFSMMSRYLGGGPGTFALQTTSDEAADVYLAATASGTADFGLLIVNGSSADGLSTSSSIGHSERYIDAGLHLAKSGLNRRLCSFRSAQIILLLGLR